jgi:hypothetical protein
MAAPITRLSLRTETLGPLRRAATDMTEHTQSTETDGDEDRVRGPIGTVVGATFGPLGAAAGTVVGETRFALKLSVGGTGSGGGASDGALGTNIEVEDADESSVDRTEGDGTARSIDDATDERAGEFGAIEGPGPDR